MAKDAKKAGKGSSKTARFGELKIGDEFYLGPHRLTKTKEDKAGEAQFGPEAVVMLEPSRC